MKTIKAVVIDDEPMARHIICDYIEEISWIDLVGTYSSATEALSGLHQHPADLLFVDINMPKVSGLDLIKSLTSQPKVIITTAYPQYALDGFELDVLDYLLKPISFERFLKAVNKILNRYTPASTEPQYFSFKAAKRHYRLLYDDIFYFQSYGDYVKIFTTKSEYLFHGTLKQLETALPAQSFLRIHKSYLINLSKIDYIEGNQVIINEEKIPVSPPYKNNLLASF